MACPPRSRLRVLVALATAIAGAAVAPVPATAHAGFGDIAAASFYTDAVQWMVDEEITTGTSPGCFAPADAVTRGQAAAFMWRMEGRPTADRHPFVDVTAGWQHDAISWMAANEITTGTSATTYSPDAVLTRGQLAALLWRLAGFPAAGAHSFVDVRASWQQGAIAWMAETGITTGTSATTFAPDAIVTRGQLATFFWRYKGEPAVEVDTSSPLCGGPADDEFDNGPIDLLRGDSSAWRVRNPTTADVIDIDSSAEGALVIVPRDFHNNGWYGTSEGPFVHQTVRGDFAAAIRITVGAADNPDAAPGNGYNSGGFVVRDGDQPNDWVMFNIGGQTPATGFAREVKTTVDGTSVLQLESIGERTHRLLICRVGSEIRYFTGASTTTEWTMDHITHSRPDFGDELEVGIVANAWESDPRPWVEVERIHFGTPSGLDECTSAVEPV